MEEKSVPDAIRELEDDFAAGRIGSKEFVRAMKDLLARRTPGPARQAETWTAPPASAPPPTPPDEHSAAAAEEPPAAGQATTPPAPPKPKPAAPAADNPWNQPDLPPIRMAEAAKAGEPKPRVIVKGAVPWDREEESMRFESVAEVERRKATGGIIHDGSGVLRERLASLADEDIKDLLVAKDPNQAALLSLLLGGGGQFYLGKTWSGIAFLAAYLAGLAGLFLGETWVLYALAPIQILAAALAQREAQARNLSIDQKRSAGERMRKYRESSFDPDKAVRTTNKLG